MQRNPVSNRWKNPFSAAAASRRGWTRMYTTTPPWPNAAKLETRSGALAHCLTTP